MDIKTFDSKGNVIEKTTLDKQVVDYVPNDTVLKQYIRVYRANKRQGTQSTKTRGEVQGSGAKPWAQKHTGRARAGEKRNPIWRHGGIAHGPKPRDWSLSLSSTIRSAALKSAFSLKASENKIFVVESLNFDKPSTKEALLFIEKTGLIGKMLIVIDTTDQNIIRSFNNISGVKTAFSDNINVYDLLSTGSILLEKKALAKLEKKFKK